MDVFVSIVIPSISIVIAALSLSSSRKKEAELRSAQISKLEAEEKALEKSNDSLWKEVTDLRVKNAELMSLVSEVKASSKSAHKRINSVKKEMRSKK